VLRRFVVILFVIVSITPLCAQDHAANLIDSLAFAKSNVERAKLSSCIARELKDTDWNRALHYLEYSEEVAKATDSDKILADVYVEAADIYYDKDVLDVALDYYRKAYDIYNQNHDKQKIIELENDLAIIYARLNDRDRALFYFKKVYKYQLKQSDTVSLAKTLNNIGTLYYFKKEPDSSELYYLKSLEIAGNKDAKLYAYLYANLGRVYFLKDNKGIAQDYFEKSLAIAKQDLDDDSRSLVFQLASDYFFNSGQIDSAIIYARKATGLLKNDTYSFRNLDAYRTLYKAYLKKEDYKNAVTSFKMYDNIRDSINVEEKAVNVERLKLQLEYSMKDKIRTLEEHKKKFTYIIIGLSLISGLLVLIVFLLRYKSRLAKVRIENELLEAKKQELNARLELKNSVLIARAMKEIHRTEIINDILEDLKGVNQKAVKQETKHAIDSIVKQLGQSVNTNIWKELEYSFEQVHASFYKNLNKKHPELTSKDRRLCALLKLNLSSKEISQITGQSFKSVENARTRLRKKFNLTNTKIDLVVYLNSLN